MENSVTLNKSDILRIEREFYDSSDSEDEPPIVPINYASVMICSKCGGSYHSVNNLLICDNSDCRMISDHNYEDIVMISNTIPTTKGAFSDPKQFYKELEMMNKIAEQEGVLPLPQEIIDTTVDLFSQMKNHRPETRNKKRKQMTGSCIYLACIAHGLMRTRKDIQRLCQLTDRNLTTTISEIEMEINKGNIVLNKDYDIRDSTTNSICIKIGIPNSAIPQIKDDVRYIIEIISDHMLVSSNFESKILGAVFIGVRVNGFEINLKHICAISVINPNTVNKVVNICTDNMELFTRFTERCEKIEQKISTNKQTVTQDDINTYVIHEATLTKKS